MLRHRSLKEQLVLHDFKIALVFLTRLPVRLGGEVSLRDLAGAVHLFPIVGALIGVVAALVYAAAAALGLPPLAVAVLAMAAGIVLTGGLHEDGLADTADAIGAGEDRARALEIMRDSRIGSFGAIALVLVLLARAAAIAALAAPLVVGPALIAAAALSRSAMPVVMLFQPSARTGGLAAGAGRPEDRRVWIGVAAAILLALLILPTVPAVTALVATTLVGAGIATLLGRRFGGCTGDTLGAVQQTAELTFLLALAASL